jgi:hypothetical protein
VLEDGREVTPAMLTLPATLGGSVSLMGCATCKRIDLTLSRDAQFFIGKREATLADMKRHLQANPKANVLVVSPINQKVVSRISASAADLK